MSSENKISRPRSIFLLDWDKESARKRIASLRAQGWRVAAESEDGAQAYRAVRASPPDVLLVDLATKPSHSRETLRSLMQSKAMRALTVVAIGGNEVEQRSIAAVAPHMRVAKEETLEAVLIHALADASTGKGPSP